MATNYDKTVWRDGDVITAEKMNNIEDGIEEIESDIITTENSLNNIENDIIATKNDFNNTENNIKQFVFNEVISNKKTALIPNIPNALPTGWNTGITAYYMSDRVIPAGAFIKSVKIGTNVANDGTIIFINNSNIVVHKYMVSCVTNDWNVFEINLLATENLRIAVNAKCSWITNPALDDTTFCEKVGLLSSNQTDVEVGDTITFTSSSSLKMVLAVQWEIEIGDNIDDRIENLYQFITNETTTSNKKTTLIPNIPSELPTGWNTGTAAYYMSDRVIPKNALIKSVKIGTNAENTGSIIFINDDDIVVYKYTVSCVPNEWNIFKLNLLATENLRIAVNAKCSWIVNTTLNDTTFCEKVGLLSSNQINVEVGDTITFTSSSTYKMVLAAQWEIETRDRISDLVTTLIDNVKSERPTSGYENFSVDVNYSDYTVNNNDGSNIYTDYGVIALPINYKSTGTPTQLIIMCGGSGDRIGANTNPLALAGWEYFLAKGYAVMDMNGISSAWTSAKGVPNTNLHYCNKHLLSSYANGYKYVIEKYNLEKRVFVAGLSMGGGAAALITQSNIIPVIANAFFCPALSVYKQDYMSAWGGTNQQITIAGQWDFPNWQTTTPSQAYFMANIDKIKGFDNLLIRTIGNHQAANENFNNTAEANAYNSMQKFYPVPIKIWHCEDDALVPFRYSQFMVNMINNGGGQAWLHSFTTGGHLGGWETGEVSDAGVTTSIPFYEAVLFFNRFG